MEEMRRLFESGALGRVLHLDANVSHNNFRKMEPGNWRRDPRHAPAGAWTALGIHLGDIFAAFAGNPVRVAARTASQIFATPSEDFVSAEIDFEGGASGRITCLSTPPFLWTLYSDLRSRVGSRCKKAAMLTRASHPASCIVDPMAAGKSVNITTSILYE